MKEKEEEKRLHYDHGCLIDIVDIRTMLLDFRGCARIYGIRQKENFFLIMRGCDVTLRDKKKNILFS